MACRECFEICKVCRVLVIVRHHIPASSPSRFVCCIILTPLPQHLCLEEYGSWLWCLTRIENGEQVVNRTAVVGHKSLSTKGLVVVSQQNVTIVYYMYLMYHIPHKTY